MISCIIFRSGAAGGRERVRLAIMSGCIEASQDSFICASDADLARKMLASQEAS